MTSGQKAFVALLAAADLLLVAILLLSVARPSGVLPSDGWPSPVPTLARSVRLSLSCEQQATEMLSREDLGGTVALTDGSLRFTLVYRLASSGTSAEIAQLAWEVFDIALVLADKGCGTFSRLEVVITPQGYSRSGRTHVVAEMEDIRAFGAGELAEDALVDRVTYWIEPMRTDIPQVRVRRTRDGHSGSSWLGWTSLRFVI